jgi:hypothetical protein
VDPDLFVLDGKPVVFFFKARILGYVDADTMDVRFLGEGPGRHWRIRLKDAWIVEDEDDPEEHARILGEQKQLIGDGGDLVWIRNHRHNRTNERLEARVDKA